MSRKFIASILAASIAVTGFSAAPARADNNDLARFLAGATALVIISRALDNDNHSKKRSSTHYYHYDDNRHGNRNYGHGNGGHHNTKVDRPKRLPPGCLTRVNTGNGSRQVFGEACLNVHYNHVASLPRSCRTHSAGPNSNAPRRGYDATCLFDRGYRATTR